MLFYKARHRTEKDSNKLLKKIIITGVVFGAAIVCYSATVFAWFQAGLLNTGNTIKAARFSVLVTVKDETNNIVPPESNGSYALVKNTVYSITITGDGNAENGYCKISDGNNVTLYTANLQEQENRSMTFSYVPENSGYYTFTACWGTAPEDAGELITDDSEIGEKSDGNYAGGVVGNNETGLHGSGTGASGTDAEQSADGTDGNTLSPVPDAGQNAGQDGEQDNEQNAGQDGQNDPADGGDEPEDGTNAGSDTADDDTANGGTTDGNTTDVGIGTGGQSDGADA